jgi:hypothetical protein
VCYRQWKSYTVSDLTRVYVMRFIVSADVATFCVGLILIYRIAVVFVSRSVASQSLLSTCQLSLFGTYVWPTCGI